MSRLVRIDQIETPSSAPRFELRVSRYGPVDTGFEVWQIPATATPQVTSSLRVAGLRGRNLELIEHRVLKRLTRAGIRMGLHTIHNAKDEKHAFPISEELALSLGLLFRTLAPMRKRDNMLAVTEGIESMEQEEAAYWLGMAMHRKHPRRVLMALRFLLTEPMRRTKGLVNT